MRSTTLAVVAAAALLAAATVVSAETHAVLVAGSNMFYNYRHQTDVCHAYHVLLDHGVPPDNIIVMLYDDIANDPANPFPGKLFNKPTAAGVPGVDVYEGCVKDYTGSEVTAANFLSVITGNSSAMSGLGSGRVLDSGSDDHVFLYFSDHGGSGIVAFPVGPFLTALDLNEALQAMHTNGMFSKLTFYLEACESGSMFQDLLPPDLNIYVTSASSPDESSWGTYCPPDDLVNGKEIGSCLGDLYSVNWMENADLADSMSETLEAQFEAVRNLTTMSHVMQWGDMDWVDEPVGDFEGNWTTDATGRRRNRFAPGVVGPRRRGHPAPVRPQPVSRKSKSRGPAPLRRGQRDPHTRSYESAMVDSRDAKLQYLYWRYARAATGEEATAAGEQLKAEIDSRRRADELFAEFARRIGGDPEHREAMLHSHFGRPANCGECCHPLFEMVRSECPALASGSGASAADDPNGWSDYALKYTRVIVNACDAASRGRQTTFRLRSVLRGLCSAAPSAF